ncbi:MAG: glycosyltransferase family 4 protein [Abditibacteriota bacterium]|nr:glycosyltransferase family 4 protein [Abditibacteriota bacterium]
MNKRICHIVQSYYPRDPRIRREATALVNAGYEVDVVCLKAPDQPKRETFEGVNIIRLPLERRRGKVSRYIFEYAAFLFMAFWYLALRPLSYSLIHISNLPDFLIFSGAVPKLFGVPILLDEHDPMPEIFEARYKIKHGSKAEKFVEWQQKASLKFATRVITTTDALAENYKNKYYDRDIRVIMNLPDTALFDGKPKTIENDPSKPFAMVFAGTVTESYNIDVAVKALPIIRKEVPNITLTVIGGGPELGKLKELAKELKVDDIVTFTGDKPLSEIPGLLEKFDVGVSTLKPTVQSELCFTTKSAEYAAMGLPVLSAHQSLLEKYYPAGMVEYFEPGSPDSFAAGAIRLWQNPDRRREMSQSAQKYVKEKFNWSAESKKYTDLISEWRK